MPHVYENPALAHERRSSSSTSATRDFSRRSPTRHTVYRETARTRGVEIRLGVAAKEIGPTT